MGLLRLFLGFSCLFATTVAQAGDYKIDVIKVETQKTLILHAVVKPEEVTKQLAKDISKVASYIKLKNIPAANTPFARYLQFEPPKPVEMETGYAVAAVNSGEGDILLHELPEGRAAVTKHVGPYEKIAPAYEAIHAWMESSGEKPGGAPWEVYLNDPAKVKPEELKTVIYYPLK